MKNRNKNAGFTLIELMVTVAVAVVTLAVGIPAWENVVANNRAVAQANEIVTAVNLAKSEAVSQGALVNLCAVDPSDSTACGSSWNDGWQVYQDADDDGAIDAAEILRLWPALEGGSSITASASSFTYNALGENTGSAATLELNPPSDSKGNHKRCIYINTVGQIRVEKVANGTSCP